MNNKIMDLETALGKVQMQEERIKKLEAMLQGIENNERSQQEKIVELEDRSRRNNLIVFGIEEKNNETNDDIRSKVLVDVFEERLGVKVTTVERIHRLGRKQDGKIRPVIVRFFDYNEKITIFKNCKKLKDTGMSVSDDFSASTLRKRKNLWDSAKARKGCGCEGAACV